MDSAQGRPVSGTVPDKKTHSLNELERGMGRISQEPAPRRSTGGGESPEVEPERQEQLEHWLRAEAEIDDLLKGKRELTAGEHAADSTSAVPTARRHQ